MIDAHLHGIKLQLQNLKRLTRSLQEATPGAKDEVMAVSSLVGEVVSYFGTKDALSRSTVDQKYAGRRALQEARYAAVH